MVPIVAGELEKCLESDAKRGADADDEEAKVVVLFSLLLMLLVLRVVGVVIVRADETGDDEQTSDCDR